MENSEYRKTPSLEPRLIALDVAKGRSPASAQGSNTLDGPARLFQTAAAQRDLGLGALINHGDNTASEPVQR